MKKSVLLLAAISTAAFALPEHCQYHPSASECQGIVSSEDGATEARSLITDSTKLYSVLSNDTDRIQSARTLRGKSGSKQSGVRLVAASKATVVSVPYSMSFNNGLGFKLAVPFVKNDVSEESGLGDMMIGGTFQSGTIDSSLGYQYTELRATLTTGDEEKGLGAGNMGYTLSQSMKKAFSHEGTMMLANASYTFFPGESEEAKTEYGSTILVMAGMERNCMLLKHTRVRAKLSYLTKASDESNNGVDYKNGYSDLDLLLSWNSAYWIKNLPIEVGVKVPLSHSEDDNADDSRSVAFFAGLTKTF